MSTPPCAFENVIPKYEKEFLSSEDFEIYSNNKSFILKISYNENIICFEIEEKNLFPNKSIYIKSKFI